VVDHVIKRGINRLGDRLRPEDLLDALDLRTVDD
jgi:hypothetical protein